MLIGVPSHHSCHQFYLIDLLAPWTDALREHPLVQKALQRKRLGGVDRHVLSVGESQALGNKEPR